MSASGCSSSATSTGAWPTPSAALTNDGESAESWQARANALKAKGTNGNGAGMPLTIAAKVFWPTPKSNDPEKRGDFDATDHRTGLPGATKLWPTPRSSPNENRTTRPAPSHGNGHGSTLAGEAAAFWPTVTARDGKGAPDTLRTGNARPLNEVAKTWGTPRSSDGAKGGPGQLIGGRPALANQAAASWGTPSTMDAPGRAYTRDGGKKGAERPALTGQAAQVPIASGNTHSTRPAPESASFGLPSSRPILCSLRRYLATTDSALRVELRALIRMSISARKAGWCRAHIRPAERRQLNVSFAEWLMGWPRGWTYVPIASGSRAMGFTLWLRRQRIALSQLSWNYEPAPGAEPEALQLGLL